VAAWALRLPSALASLLFLIRFRAWAARFVDPEVARLATLILATTPIWFWQSQFIQIDMLFSALLAWAWFCWLGGYLLQRRVVEARFEGEAGRFFLRAYLFLGLAFLAKGPLSLVLSLLVLLAFLGWQRDGSALRSMRLGTGMLVLAGVVMPWYVAAGIKGGGGYVYAMVIHQNVERATKAWDHIQPFYQYVIYILGDFFPWVLLLPTVGAFLWRSWTLRTPAARFLFLSVTVPFLFLSLVQSKQGKYLLMSYPFLALLVAGMIRSLVLESPASARLRRYGILLASVFAGLGVGLLVLALGGGKPKLQVQLAPFRPLVGALALVALGGALHLAWRIRRGEGRHLVVSVAAPIGLLFLLGGTWGFHRLDPQKGYRAWTARVEPLVAGKKVYFWGEIRSGAMIYLDLQMPEIRQAKALSTLSPEDRMVVIRSRWVPGYQGLTQDAMGAFEPLVEHAQGSDTWMLLRKVR
jgi:4-amino-4-deoxy-L-arabinose transferase-like glycosyltransferase